MYIHPWLLLFHQQRAPHRFRSSEILAWFPIQAFARWRLTMRVGQDNMKSEQQHTSNRSQTSFGSERAHEHSGVVPGIVLFRPYSLNINVKYQSVNQGYAFRLIC